MNELINQRLVELKQEFESGQKMLAETEDKAFKLKQSLLRISGAIQVLDELIQADSDMPDNVKEMDAMSAKSVSV